MNGFEAVRLQKLPQHKHCLIISDVSVLIGKRKNPSMLNLRRELVRDRFDQHLSNSE